MPSTSSKDAINYLENDLMNAISKDLVSILNFYEKQQNAGFHSIPVKSPVFCKMASPT